MPLRFHAQFYTSQHCTAGLGLLIGQEQTRLRVRCLECGNAQEKQNQAWKPFASSHFGLQHASKGP
jgi:hypothetical protein